LKDFIQSNCKKIDENKGINRDEFRIRYNEYCKRLGYKQDKSKNQTFTKSMKLQGINNKENKNAPYGTFYLGLEWDFSSSVAELNNEILTEDDIDI